jgi:hypothetical protein
VALIAATFCKHNHYVDRLTTWQPQDEGFYRVRGTKTAREASVSMRKEDLPTKNRRTGEESEYAASDKLNLEVGWE